MHPSDPYATKKPDFTLLASRYADLAPFVETNSEGFANIDWKNSDALRALTRALLKDDWDLEVDLPEDRLCPTVANRLEYIYHLLDLRPFCSRLDQPLRVIDVGTGAVAIYPLLLHRIDRDATIIATEKDTTSLEHAKTVAYRNGIESSSIDLRAPCGNEILFPLLEDEHLEVDMTMCNPPFFASSAEMQDGQAMKAKQAHTAHTGSDNEMVVEGGEVGFISQMMDESLRIGTRCSWYTSLVGRYSSLFRLVDKLSSLKVNNYYLLSIRPSKTVRWIIIWSFTNTKLPDSLTRPVDQLEVPTSFIRLLPPPNTVRHVVRPYRPASDVSPAIKAFLERIKLLLAVENDDTVIRLEARSNTWSRAARRKLAQTRIGDGADGNQEETPVLLKGTLRILDGSVEMDWTYGHDRAEFDGLWQSILANSGLVNRGAPSDTPRSGNGQKRKAADGEQETEQRTGKIPSAESRPTHNKESG